MRVEERGIALFFITGDEHFYKFIKSENVQKILGYKPHESKELSVGVWKQLCKKFNVFHLHKPYYNKIEKDELLDWEEAIGPQRILEMETPKACIDVILGAIALTSGVRTMEGYIKDMEKRGQDKDRIKEVTHALRKLTPSFLADQTVRNVVKPAEVKKVEEEKKEEL